MRRLISPVSRFFSGSGPYNPCRYKNNLIPRNFPRDDEIFPYIAHVFSTPGLPIRNVRHVNPIRQSGPLPPYDGPVTMDDVRKVFFNSTIGIDYHPCQVLPDELMRRVPGLTRKEAEHIVKLGLNPDEQVDFAYIAKNIGLDVFYFANGAYSGRQVVTNSKGEKVEVYISAMQFEDMSQVSVTHAPTLHYVDYTWEIFLWGDGPIHPWTDFDLGLPSTWFEYEEELFGEFNMLEDQMNLPDDLRIHTPRHPNARRELWKPQEIWHKMDTMKDPEWFPQDVKTDIYNYQNKESTGEKQIQKTTDAILEMGKYEVGRNKKTTFGFLKKIFSFGTKEEKAKIDESKDKPDHFEVAKKVQVPIHHDKDYSELRQAEVEPEDFKNPFEVPHDHHHDHHDGHSHDGHSGHDQSHDHHHHKTADADHDHADHSKKNKGKKH